MGPTKERKGGRGMEEGEGREGGTKGRGDREVERREAIEVLIIKNVIREVELIFAEIFIYFFF